jgi:ABC-type dipeptide/oligopeptide/nickel transport system permease component
MPWNYILRRLIQAFFVLMALSIVVFTLVRLAPGDPALARLGVGEGSTVTREAYLAEKKALGLDRPIPVQYFIWLGTIFRGDLGIDIRAKKPIMGLVYDKFKFTLPLAVGGLVLGVAVAIPLGIIAGTRPFTWVDNSISAFSLFGVAAPSFWIGLMLILFFSVKLGWFPVFGAGPPGSNSIHLKYMVLPIVAVSVQLFGSQTRFMRSGMLDVMNTGYIRTAYAKGLSNNIVILRHALKNALLPVVTIIGLNFAATLGSSIVTESVFRWPGMGLLLVEAIKLRDYGLIQILVLFLAVIYVFVNLLVDLAYGFLDPRVHYE